VDPVDYKVGGEFDLDQVLALYQRSTLAERRPVEDRACLAQMMEQANLIVTAWQGDRLVGIARTMTDFCYVAYLADLAVDAEIQRRGVGLGLMIATRSQLGPGATIVLLAAPAAEGYYPHVGFRHHPQAWVLRPEDVLANEG
jgi:GNAT superfamily N-acetyltransferase